MKPEQQDFQTFQRQLAEYIRGNRQAPPSGAPFDRLEVYRELFFNNIKTHVNACYPVTRKILGDMRWQELLRRFFTSYHCHSPFFRDIPGEFLRFLQDSGALQPADPKFLIELAHYEWVELALAVSADPPPAKLSTTTDLMQEVPVLNPVIALLAYQYPVEKISTDFQPIGSLSPTFLAMFRSTDHHSIQFVRLNGLSYRLLQLLSLEPDTGHATLHKLAEELPQINETSVHNDGKKILELFFQKGIILGSVKT